MKKSTCFLYANITKTVGIDGCLKAVFSKSYFKNINELESIFIEIDKLLVPFFIEVIEIYDSYAMIWLEDIDTIEKTKELVNKNTYLPNKLQPKATDNILDYNLLENFSVNYDNKIIGFITNFIHNKTQPIMIITNNKNEYLLPFAKELILSLNLDDKIIFYKHIPGLLRINE